MLAESLLEKGPFFQNSWRPCEARKGLAESLFFPSPALPASLRIPAPGSPPYSGSRILSPPGRKILVYPNGEILYDRLKMAAIRRMDFLQKVERSM